jgi:hypothetical protein
MLAVVTTGKVASVTASVLSGLDPQVLFAVTVMVPPAVPVVAVIEVVVELPVQPVGSFQVYEAAPETAEIL